MGGFILQNRIFLFLFLLFRFMIATTWLLGYGAGWVYLMGDRVTLYAVPGTNVSVCRYGSVSLSEVTTITLVTFSLQNVVPFFVMSVSSTLIVWQLRKHNDNTCLMNESELYRRRNRTRKTMKLLLVVCSVFLICITPVNIFQLILILDTDGGLWSYQYLEVIHTILSMMMMANSCINPIIYSRLHTTFRKQILALFNAWLLTPYRCASRRVGASFRGGNRRKSIRRKTLVERTRTGTTTTLMDEDNGDCTPRIGGKSGGIFSFSSDESTRVRRCPGCSLGNMWSVVHDIGTKCFKALKGKSSVASIEGDDCVFFGMSLDCLETQLENVRETVL